MNNRRYKKKYGVRKGIMFKAVKIAIIREHFENSTKPKLSDRTVMLFINKYWAEANTAVAQIGNALYVTKIARRMSMGSKIRMNSHYGIALKPNVLYDRGALLHISECKA